jgi:N-6 DNA Methylase
MPRYIRKLLAAFYTRPQAAEILARLCVRKSTDTVFDTACGSGTILVAAYRQKLELQAREGRTGNSHKRFCESEIFGADIMPFAVHLTSANLAAMDVSTNIAHTQIIPADAIEPTQGRHYGTSLQLGLFSPARRARTSAGEEFEVVLQSVHPTRAKSKSKASDRSVRPTQAVLHQKLAVLDPILYNKGAFDLAVPCNKQSRTCVTCLQKFSENSARFQHKGNKALPWKQEQ